MTDTRKKRIAVITGGSVGLGFGIAQRLAADGCSVALLGRSVGPLREATERIGPSAEWHQADVGKRADVEKAIGAVVAKHGRIDVLVNNAGVMPLMTLETPFDEAERIWHETMATNLTGAFLVTRAAAPHLTSPGARIINLSSITGITGGSRAGFLAYAASKGGIEGLTFALARELGPKGITVNAVAPGFTGGTQMSDSFTPEIVARILTNVPLNRPGKVEDIAGTVAFLASEDGGYVTGQIIGVNGGWRFSRG